MVARLAKSISAFFSRLAAGIGHLPALLKDPKTRWRVIIPAVIVLAIVGGSIYYYEGIFLPSQKPAQAALQTTVARRGSIVLSAVGTGTLQAASQIGLGFKSNGTLTQMNVKVGDQVKQGQVLAEQDNSSQQIQLQQAKQTLAGQTNVSAVAAAQQAIATATKTLGTAQQHLAYVISPSVYYWENQITADEQAVSDAQAALVAAPTDKVAQANLKTAQDALANAKDKLVGAQADYETYVENHFSYVSVNISKNHAYKHYVPPSDVDILQARSAVTVAQGALKDAQNLYTALTTGNLPADASGTGLNTLGQAQLGVQTAQDNLEATQLIAPFSGTVVAVSANVGDSVGNSAVITLADMSKLYLLTYVDESDYAKFAVGNTADIVFDALPDGKFTGKVTEVDPAVNTSSGSAVVSGLVQLDPSTAHLILGMSASVTVISAQTQGNAILIPVAALHQYAPGKYAVFVMRSGKLTVQFVEVGLQDLVSAEIKSGLQVGDAVSTGLLATR